MLEKNLAAGDIIFFTKPGINYHPEVPDAAKIAVPPIQALGSFDDTCARAMTVSGGGKRPWTCEVKWLQYFSGFITEAKLGGDILTGPFQGCYIVVYKRSDSIWVGHIGTSNVNPAHNNAVKRYWTDWAIDHPADKLLVAYNPYSQWGKKFEANAQLYGLISADHQCHAISLVQDRNNYRVTAMKRIPPLKRGAADLRNLFPGAADLVA